MRLVRIISKQRTAFSLNHCKRAQIQLACRSHGFLPASCAKRFNSSDAKHSTSEPESSSLPANEQQSKPDGPLPQPFGKDVQYPVFRDPTFSYEALNKAFTLPETALEKRALTIDKVRSAIQAEFGPEYDVQPFGSTTYGVSGPNADLDMVVLDPYKKNGDWNKGLGPRTRLMKRLYDIRYLEHVIRNAEFRVKEIIPSASVPLIKFRDMETRLEVDLNVNERLGLMNSAMLRQYCQVYPPLRVLIVLIKLWAKPRGLNSPSIAYRTPTFSSYALTLMTISLLQKMKLLPNLQADLPPLAESGDDGYFLWKYQRCDTRFNDIESWNTVSEPPIPDLYQKWFRYWALEHNFQETASDIRQGGFVPINEVSPFGPRPCVVKDPFIVSKNCTVSLTEATINRFKAECQHTYDQLRQGNHLQSILFLNPAATRSRPLSANKAAGKAFSALQAMPGPAALLDDELLNNTCEDVYNFGLVDEFKDAAPPVPPWPPKKVYRKNGPPPPFGDKGGWKTKPPPNNSKERKTSPQFNQSDPPRPKKFPPKKPYKREPMPFMEALTQTKRPSKKPKSGWSVTLKSRTRPEIET